MAADPVTALAPMPGCNMKIFSGDPTYKEVAENVKIGDPLTLVITIDEQDTYGIRITDCLVRDGLGWGEQKLINDEGCPLDAEIMGRFEYSEDKTKASVHFQAHKFPYTASVYYQCNVKLCLKADGGCDISVSWQRQIPQKYMTTQGVNVNLKSFMNYKAENTTFASTLTLLIRSFRESKKK